MLILKQNAANTVPTPAAGKGTIFLSDSDVLSVKNSSGVVESFPTVGGSNTQVIFNDDSALGGSANYTFDKDTNVLTVTGNVAATRILTDNLLYANGAAWDLQEAAGSNTEIQFNDGSDDFGASSNFTFDTATNTLTVTGTASATTLSGTTLSVTGNASAGNISATAALSGDTLNITNDALIGGNLVVDGNLTYINVENLAVEDPLIELGTGPNGAPLTTNDGKDRGTVLDYYSGSALQAFMGWDNSNAEFAFGSDVTIDNDVVNFVQLGNLRANMFIGNGASLSDIVGANVTGEVAFANTANAVAGANVSGEVAFAATANAVAGANVSGQVGNALVAGTVYTNAQPNITSVGTLANLYVGAGTQGDYTGAKIISATANGAILGVTDNIGVVGEAHADGANSSIVGIGVYGVGQTANSTRAAGVRGDAFVSATGDTGAAVGVRGHSTQTHSGGYNIGLLGVANSSGIANYALYLQEGDIASIENGVTWDLVDNAEAALNFGSTGKSNIFLIETTDNAEGIATSGYLNVTGNATVGGIKTDNYYYANGAPLDFQQPAGSNTQVQYNNDDDFGASANFTFDSSTNTLSVTNLSATDVSATTVAGTLTTAAQPNVTSVGTLSSLDVTGNVGAGNVSATDVSGTTLGGTLTTAAQPNITSVGTLTGLDVNGNITAVNITANTGVFTGDAGGLSNVVGANVTGTVANATHASTANTIVDAAQPNITSVGTLTGLDVNGNITAVNITANTGVFTGDAGGLSNVVGANVTGEVAFAATANSVAGANVSDQVANALVAGTVYTNAQPNITSVGTLTSLDVTGNVGAGNVSATDISGTTLGGTLTTAAQPNITSVGTLTSLSVTGNASAGNISTAGALTVTGNANVGNLGATGVTATTLTGSLTTNAQPNITSVGTLTSVTITGNVAAGNLTTTGILSVTGTGTSSIAGNLDMTSKNISNLATPVNSTDATTKQYVDDLASTALVYHEGVIVATTDTLANTTSGAITYNNGSNGVGATLTTTGTFNLIDTANVQTVGTRILVKDEANAAHNGVYTYSNTTVITRATDADSYGPGAGELSLNNYFFVSGGDENKGSAYVVDAPTGEITFGTSNIEFAQFSSSQIYLAGTGLTLTDLTFSVNESQTQITSVGTLTGLAVNGNITAANITANTGVFTGNGSGLSAIAGGNVTGQVANALVAGTVYTAAQPNITSVGTLTSLSVTGNVSAGNVSATSGAFTSVSGNGSALSAITGANVTGTVSSATTAGTVTSAAQANITSVGTLTGLTIAANGDITMSGTGSQITGVALVSSTLFAGSGANLTNLNGSNISTGTIAAARVATLNQNTTGYAATVSTAAQPNITSVGTLTSLSVTGNANIGNVGATNFVGSGASLTSLNGSNITSGTIAAGRVATLNQNTTGYAATVSTAAQPNITSVGTLTSLAISGTNTLTVRTISTGANATTGTITGNWSLSAGSKLNATYADLAEKYTADQPYEPGTVVVFGGEAELSVSGSKGTHAVAGIITSEPAQVYNADLVAPEGQFVVELALIGRVPCKVIGPVVKGDLIIASDNAGFGCSADPETVKAGSVIGKAIQSYNGDTPDGIIEVLVGKN